MSAAQPHITARERLAQSRERLLQLVPDTRLPLAAGGVQGKAPVVPALAATLLARWWHRHPARVIFQLARPALDDYAMRRPMQLVAYGAGAGCLLVLLHSRKLLSAGLVLTLIVARFDVPASVARLADAQRVDADNDPAFGQASGAPTARS
jgi:hypothetical protein